MDNRTSIKEFDEKAQIGDIIINNNIVYHFMGFEKCLYQYKPVDDYCPKCKGLLILFYEDGKIEKDCFRSTDNYIQGKLIKSFIIKEEEFKV